MNTVLYSMESCIQHFFNTLTTATRAECDIKAASLIGEPIRPVPVQGLWSYTVIAGPRQADIVQFRAGQSKLDMTNVKIATQIHTRCAPGCSYWGQIGGQFPLSIYVMEKRDGVCYIQTRDTSTEGKVEFEIRQSRTVGDLAKFFAAAWANPQQVTLRVINDLRDEFEADLYRLSRGLPDRFTKILDHVRECLPRMFTLPFVITHGDLNETNILVDNDGRITGVIDWAECKILPFGMSLWALENVLGYMDTTGWHYHENAKKLREEFWQVFEMNIDKGIQKATVEDIYVARMVGMFLRYGFEQNGSKKGKVRDRDDTLRYADAFCSEERIRFDHTCGAYRGDSGLTIEVRHE